MAITNEQGQFFGTGLSLAEPHFDEEATVLSAKPVVPLTNVKQVDSAPKKTALRPWVLGLSLMGALLVGILATAMYYSRASGDDSKVLDATELSAGAAATPAETENVFSGPAVEQKVSKVNPPVADASQRAVRDEKAKTAAAPQKKPAPRLVEVITENQRPRRDSEEDRDDLKAERREAREARRRDRRERKTSDDLMRIRDIFEGSPRP